jgi:hypothetical protein
MITDVSVNLNLSKKPGNIVRAFVDVTLSLGDGGTMKLCGFRVLVPDGKPPWVSPPARHGERAWFDTVILKGPVKKLVDTAVIKEFEKTCRQAKSEQ